MFFTIHLAHNILIGLTIASGVILNPNILRNNIVTGAIRDANLGHTHHCTNVKTLVNITDVSMLTRSATIIACLNVICGTATTQDLWIKYVSLKYI